MLTIIDGIIVAGLGGFGAWIAVHLLKHFIRKFSENRDGSTIYDWLGENSSDKGGYQFRSTRAISSGTNLTKDRVRYLCSRHDRIFLSTGEKEDRWSIHTRTPRSFYEDHDLKVL